MRGDGRRHGGKADEEPCRGSGVGKPAPGHHAPVTAAPRILHQSTQAPIDRELAEADVFEQAPEDQPDSIHERGCSMEREFFDGERCQGQQDPVPVRDQKE